MRLVTISEGDVSTLQVGFKGTMNALFLQDLADTTRRGLRGRVEDGRSAGGVSYGYRVVRAPDGAPRGDREILAEEARVVERSQDGERLITVAISRARARLVITLSRRDRENVILDYIARCLSLPNRRFSE